MNKLLIHSNNTSFNLSELFPIEEQFVFDVDFDTDVDSYIDKILCEGELFRKLIKVDIVFIKVSLSQNYLEYLGLRLSYHIRLTKSLGLKSNLPIVLIAEESIQFLGNTYSEPSILLSGGIYFIKENIADYYKIIKWYSEGQIKSLEKFTTFIDSVNIQPPSNYQSHHLIANEWALTRYFSMLEKDESNERYVALKNKIEGLDYLKTLHFKYLEARASRQKFNPKNQNFTPLINGIENKSIGIIDDEINKGWLTFYEYLFSKSNIQLVAFNDFKKYESRIALINRIQNWFLENIQSNNSIDLFIIDLRLHDDDYSDQDFDNLSGVQIIKYIKLQNPGIQIVVSTASNKVWNFQKCLDQGVNYYTVKESPETYNTREETRTTLVHFNRQIVNASQKSSLANLYREIQNLKTNNIFLKSNKETEFENLIFGKNGLLDQTFHLLILDNNNEIIINQCLLLAFQVLENYCDLPSVASFGIDSSSGIRLASGFVWLKSLNKKDVFINLPNQKISTWFELVFGKFNFQTDDSNETPISYKVFNKMETISSYMTGLDVSALVKVISVLHFRDNISPAEINKIIRLRYYRSNVAAHFTGKVKPDCKKITIEDIAFFIEIFKQVFI